MATEGIKYPVVANPNGIKGILDATGYMILRMNRDFFHHRDEVIRRLNGHPRLLNLLDNAIKLIEQDIGPLAAESYRQELKSIEALDD